MPHAFVHLYPELESALDQSLVLTTTERLRRNLIRAYNDAKLAAGYRAWPTPRVLTIGAYLAVLYQALRRDTGDEQLVVRFVREVGSAEQLQMLFVLTAADLAAVGPGVWEGWKAEILTDLYGYEYS